MSFSGIGFWSARGGTMAAGGVAALRRLPLASGRSITCRIPSETIADTHRGRQAHARIESQQIRPASYPAEIGRQPTLWLRRLTR